MNTAPTISSIATQSTQVGVAVGPIAFTVGDAQTAAGSLTLSATSSNTTLVPTSAVTFGGSGANRTVTVKPAAGQSGTATITVKVSDGAAQASTSFVLTVSAPAKPASGLVAAYAFNETSGTTAGDASGNGNAGAVTDATWSSAGKFGGALVFNGSSSLVYVKPSASLNLGAKMTLSAWVKPTATQSGWRTIVQKQVDSYFLHASSNSAMKPAAGGTFGGKKAWATSPTALTVGAWTHLAVSYDGANVRLFINGRQVASQAQTGAIESNGNGLRIGGTVPYGEYFKGLIDEVRVYNRSLSESEIRADMNAPIAAADTDAPLQNVWSETSVGKVGLTGSESSDERTATLTVKGAGTEIGGNADAFHFVYRPLQGDGVVETRIDSVAASHGGAKAGVMIRESLAPGARNVFLGLTPNNGARLQSRVWAGGATNAITAPNLSPYWVRLERSGSTVVASISADGTHWTEVKKVWIPMAKNAYIGFAVTSRDTQKLATAVFGEPFIE
ncbi:MAG TPA: LamG-like jellyroll fold domain-containing protein [Opitutus sp.]|nr:LamG-like jellyroll fold domain-containing protein [Opitutus sp.]